MVKNRSNDTNLNQEKADELWTTYVFPKEKYDVYNTNGIKTIVLIWWDRMGLLLLRQKPVAVRRVAGTSFVPLLSNPSVKNNNRTKCGSYFCV